MDYCSHHTTQHPITQHNIPSHNTTSHHHHNHHQHHHPVSRAAGRTASLTSNAMSSVTHTADINVSPGVPIAVNQRAAYSDAILLPYKCTRHQLLYGNTQTHEIHQPSYNIQTHKIRQPLCSNTHTQNTPTAI